MSTFPLARRDPRDAAQDNRAAAVKRSLFYALKGLDPALLQRDLAELKGDTRRKALLSRQIAELLDRLKSEAVETALGRPLGEAYRDGFNTRSGERGARSEVALDRDKIRSLVRALTDPLTDAMHRAKSPLPYIMPKLIQPDQKEAFLGTAMEAAAQGMTSRQFGKLLREKGVFDRQTLHTADGGPFVEFPNGYRMGAARYVETVAKTTTYWASNRGVLDRCAEDGIELVEVVENPGTIDFCLELEGKVFALTDEAAQKTGVPLLADCPGGGVPAHPNCRHFLVPFVWLGEKLPAADPAVMTGKASTAQHEFLKKLDADPMKYARQIAESAARRGFGEHEQRMNKGWYRALQGKEIPGIVGRKETFGPRALSEDAHLAKRIGEGWVATRAEYRIKIAETLRNAANDPANVASRGGTLYYRDASTGWLVEVEARTGLVWSGFKMEGTWEEFKRRHKL